MGCWTMCNAVWRWAVPMGCTQAWTGALLKHVCYTGTAEGGDVMVPEHEAGPRCSVPAGLAHLCTLRGVSSSSDRAVALARSFCSCRPRCCTSPFSASTLCALARSTTTCTGTP